MTFLFEDLEVYLHEWNETICEELPDIMQIKYLVKYWKHIFHILRRITYSKLSSVLVLWSISEVSKWNGPKICLSIDLICQILWMWPVEPFGSFPVRWRWPCEGRSLCSEPTDLRRRMDTWTRSLWERFRHFLITLFSYFKIFISVVFFISTAIIITCQLKIHLEVTLINWMFIILFGI